MFIRKKGKTKFMYFPIAASVAIGKGAAVALASGTIVAALNDVAVYNVVGVLAEERATTDADYAVAKQVAVEVPVEKWVEWEVLVNSTLATWTLLLQTQVYRLTMALAHWITSLSLNLFQRQRRLVC